MKARSRLYAWVLAYLLWTSRARWWQRSLAWWGVPLALAVPMVVMEQVLGWGDHHPVVRAAYYLIGLVVLAWYYLPFLAIPLFNLALRRDPVARHVLTSVQILETNLIGVLLILMVASLLLSALGLSASFVLFIAALLLLMPVPLIFRCEPGWPRAVMACVVGIVALLFALSFCLALGATPLEQVRGLPMTMFFVSMGAWAVSLVIGNWWLVGVIPKR